MTGTNILTPIVYLCIREITRFYRQKSRILGVLFTPILFWLVLGFGFGESFKTIQDGVEIDYLKYFFPGIVTLVILFTAVFSNISLIEDRNEGFLQGVLIAPISSFSIVTGKISGGIAIALFQGILLYFISPLAGYTIGFVAFLLFLLSCLLTAGALSALGFYLAWRINSVQGFHSIMNVGLIPLWLLSGAVFPSENVNSVLHYIMVINPLRYGVELIKFSLYTESLYIIGNALFLTSLTVSVCFLIISTLLASKTVSKTRLE
jgi:ABC-2 type transport system permease protein